MKWKIVIALLLSPSLAHAQQELNIARINLGVPPCLMRNGSGAPTGGASCEFYLDTSTGHVWVNHGGTWIDASTRTPVFATVNATTSVTTPLVSATTNVTTPVLIASTNVETPLILTNASVNLTLRPAGDLIVNPTGRDILPGQNYYTNIGSPFNKFLTLHAAELDLETLVAQDVISTIGGRVVVAPTTALVADITAASTSITVKHNQAVNGDILRLEGNGQVEFMQVTSAASGPAGAYVYSVTRNLDGSGANAWIAGDAVLNTGSVGRGFIDLYAQSGLLSGFGPTIVGDVRVGAAYNQISPRWALGNLNSVGYGHAANYYGFAAGNPAGAYMYLDDVNGLVMTGPAGIKMQITPAGTALFSGDGNGVTNINGGNIATRSITAIQIATQTLTANEIGVGTLTGDRLAANTITGDKLVANSIVAGHIVAGNVTQRELGGYAVTWDKIAPGHVIAQSIGEGQVINGKIGDGAVNTPKIADNSINTYKVCDGCLYGYADIVAGSIYAAEIGAGQITTDHLGANVVTAAKIDAYAIYAKSLNANDIYSGTVRSNAMYSNDMYSNTVRSNEMYSNNIYSNTLTSNTLNSNTLNSSYISGGTITGTTITGNTINGGTVNGTDINGTNINGVNLTAANGNVVINSSGFFVSGGGGAGSIHVSNQTIYADCCSIGLSSTINVQGDINGTGQINVSGGHAYLQDITARNYSGGSMDVDYIHVWGGYADFNGQIHAKSDAFLDRDANIGRHLSLSGEFYWDPPFINDAMMTESGGRIGSVRSSIRFKENLRLWAPKDPLAILTVPLYLYDIKAQPKHDLGVQPNILGVMAEDVFKVAPEMVTLDKENLPYSIRPDGMTTYMLAAMRELLEKIRVLETEVTALKKGKS